jgi:DNA polymerase III epsilon subunit-like protein
MSHVKRRVQWICESRRGQPKRHEALKLAIITVACFEEGITNCAMRALSNAIGL